MTCDRKNSKKKDDVIAFIVEILVMSSCLHLGESWGLMLSACSQLCSMLPAQ